MTGFELEVFKRAGCLSGTLECKNVRLRKPGEREIKPSAVKEKPTGPVYQIPIAEKLPREMLLFLSSPKKTIHKKFGSDDDDGGDKALTAQQVKARILVGP